MNLTTEFLSAAYKGAYEFGASWTPQLVKNFVPQLAKDFLRPTAEKVEVVISEVNPWREWSTAGVGLAAVGVAAAVAVDSVTTKKISEKTRNTLYASAAAVATGAAITAALLNYQPQLVVNLDRRSN